MVDSPLVTVICLCHNHERFVIESLNSVASQDYPNIEIIIVDNGSKDKSVSLISNWAKTHTVEIIINKTNLGLTRAFNEALVIAKGIYIVDLSTDDVLLPSSILNRVKTFKFSKYKNLGVVFSNVQYIDEEGNHLKYLYPVDDQFKSITKPVTGNIYEAILHSFFLSSPSMLIKKEAYIFLNGYDETLDYEDLDFWIRSSRVYDYDFTDNILVKKREVSNSLSTHFYKRGGFNLGESTYRTCKKAHKLNRTRSEDFALLNRVLYEIRLALKNVDIQIFTKFYLLYIRVVIFMIFRKRLSD